MKTYVLFRLTRVVFQKVFICDADLYTKPRVYFSNGNSSNSNDSCLYFDSYRSIN